MKKKYIVILGLIVILACLFIPYRTVLVPKWRVQIVDENGNAYKSQMIDQFCSNYTLDVDPCVGDDTRQHTDENGYVDFPERTFSMGLVHRILISIKSHVFRYIAHGGVGTEIRLTSIDYPAGTSELKYIPESGPPPERWIIASTNAYR